MAQSASRSSRPLFASLVIAAGGLACSDNGVEQNMNSPQVIPSATVTTYHDTDRAEVFVVTAEGKGRELATIQFFEKRPDLGEIERLKKADWKVKVPDGHELFIATAGQRRDTLKTSWVGWKDQTTLNALSLYLEKPVPVAVAATDRFVHPPAIVNRRMHQYFFRPDGARSQLWRHEFVGDMGRPGACQTQKVLDLPAAPVVAALAPMSGPDGAVVLAWVESGREGLRLGAVLIKNEPSKLLRTEPYPNLTPLERARLGVYATPDSPSRISCVAQTLDGSEYGLVEAVCDFNGGIAASTEPLPLPENSLHSAASFYLKHPDEPHGFTCLLTKRGVLLLYEYEELRGLRREVPLDYDFPVVTTLGARHEAIVNPQGAIEMITID